MPKVPEPSSDNVVRMPMPKASPADYLMAAADLHFSGALKELVTTVSEHKASMGLAADAMNDDEYDASWVRSEARRGRSDAQMRAIHPELEAYRLSPDSDLISYHKKRQPKPEDLVS